MTRGTFEDIFERKMGCISKTTHNEYNFCGSYESSYYEHYLETKSLGIH